MESKCSEKIENAGRMLIQSDERYDLRRTIPDERMGEWKKVRERRLA